MTQPVTSTVLGLKQTFQSLGPEYLNTYRAGETVTKGDGGTIGDFVPGHLPGDPFVDKDKRKNMERLLESHKNFSHKAFITANPPTDKTKHGAWDGTFARYHGGWPHMFESLAKPKDPRWLGEIQTKMVNATPMLVNGPSAGGPGFPNRTIGGDHVYESEFNYAHVEKLNRQHKLGYGPGHRTEVDKSKNGGQYKPWMTTTVQPMLFDKDGSAHKEVADGPANTSGNAGGGKYLTKYISRAAALAARANHTSPFISAATERKLPGELFGTYGYMSEPFVDDTYKRFDNMVKEANTKKGIVQTLTHGPFKCAGKTVLSRPSPSVMFRRAR